MKKILYLNIILIALIFVASIAIFYSYNFPIPFDFIRNFKDYEIQYVLIILLIIGFLASLIASVKIKKYNFKNKFLSIFLILNCLFLAFLVFNGSSEYIKRKKALTLLENEYIKQAKKDIENDKVTYKFAGGLAVSDYNEETENKIDSIYKNYGVTYFNTGCIIDFMDIKAQEKYQETVKPYLIKRNGKNWEVKMKSEIEKIKN
ncbi:hypothetical protein SAMN05421857_0641 [Chryseobacterium formosense]|uniref:FEKKY domain-containing protein n=1 Tax=Chryseobacterium formosense TaxID=236814 RepID=UPI0006909EBE|nr:hypothetical protein [Chryseobacterium formosense]SFT38987.1 hypothetical protein SAMN05421857_0641 [Chryseobacterium formosense]